MSGRFTLRNTSRYPTAEVRALVKFAMSECDVRGVCVNVKNSTWAYRGMAYQGVPCISNAPPQADYLVTVGIGGEQHFPMTVARAPVDEFRSWQEALVAVAAHEAKHIEQFRESKPTRERPCVAFEMYMLTRYRQEKETP